MKRNALVLATAGWLALLMPVIACAEIWTFDKIANREGWSVPEQLTGATMGGALWLSFNPIERDPARLSNWMYQLYRDPDFLKKYFSGIKVKEDSPTVDIVSPSGLSVSASSQSGGQIQLALRVFNLSVATDFFFRWREKSAEPERWSTSQCAVKPDFKEWQELRCFVPKSWQGTIDQIAIGFSPNLIRGDLWIDRVEIGAGPPPPAPVRPDIASDKLIPRISVPGIEQADVSKAFRALDDCMVVDVPAFGFPYPYLTFAKFDSEEEKGRWWPIDTMINAQAASWTNARFGVNVVLGFREVQKLNPDGRINGYSWETTRGQVGNASMQPMFFFETAYVLSRRTNDSAVRHIIYETMQLYLDWWLSPVKRDAATGLIIGTWEEVLFPLDESDFFGADVAETRAPVSLNVGVAVSAHYTALLARSLGKTDDARRYAEASQQLSEAINERLWDANDKVYYDLNVQTGQKFNYLTAATFFPLRLAALPADRQAHLLARLTDPAQFNFGKTAPTGIPVSSKTHKAVAYVLTDTPIVSGLKESGKVQLASKVNWDVIQTFKSPFPVEVDARIPPKKGKRQDGAPFGFSAAAFVLAIVETLFGIDVDLPGQKLRIAPYVPEQLYGKQIAIDGLVLPGGEDTRLSVRVTQHAAKSASISLSLSGPLPPGEIEIELPGSGRKVVVPMQRSYSVAL